MYRAIINSGDTDLDDDNSLTFDRLDDARDYGQRLLATYVGAERMPRVSIWDCDALRALPLVAPVANGSQGAALPETPRYVVTARNKWGHVIGMPVAFDTLEAAETYILDADADNFARRDPQGIAHELLDRASLTPGSEGAQAADDARRITFEAGGAPQSLTDGEWLTDSAGDRWRVRFGHVDRIGRQHVTLGRAADLAYRDDTAGGVLDRIHSRALRRVADAPAIPGVCQVCGGSAITCVCELTTHSACGRCGRIMTCNPAESTLPDAERVCDDCLFARGKRTRRRKPAPVADGSQTVDNAASCESAVVAHVAALAKFDAAWQVDDPGRADAINAAVEAITENGRAICERFGSTAEMSLTREAERRHYGTSEDAGAEG